jgi:hypothetical protein
MVCRCEGNLHSDLVVEILEHAAVKVLSVVNYYLLRNSIVTNDVFLEEFFDGRRGYVGDGLRLNPLCEVFQYHDGEDVVALCWLEFDNDINAPPLQGRRWGDQLRRLR